MRLSDHTYFAPGDRQKITTDASRIFASIVTRLHRLTASFADARARSRELNDLYRFSDRELWDVGLSRSDVWSIERGTYRRE